MARKAGEYTMKSLDQVRILAHPVRLKLLEAFAEPRTTKQAAEALKMPATRLYHHVNALERVGLIRLKSTKPVRGTVEKYYESVAKRIMVGADLFGEKREQLQEAVASVIEEASTDLRDALERADATPDNLRPLALRAMISASPAQIAALRKKMLELLQNFRKTPKGKGAKGKGAKARVTLVFTAETD